MKKEWDEVREKHREARERKKRRRWSRWRNTEQLAVLQVGKWRW